MAERTDIPDPNPVEIPKEQTFKGKSLGAFMRSRFENKGVAVKTYDGDEPDDIVINPMESVRARFDNVIPTPGASGRGPSNFGVDIGTDKNIKSTNSRDTPIQRKRRVAIKKIMANEWREGEWLGPMSPKDIENMTDHKPKKKSKLSTLERIEKKRKEAAAKRAHHLDQK